MAHGASHPELHEHQCLRSHPHRERRRRDLPGSIRAGSHQHGHPHQGCHVRQELPTGNQRHKRRELTDRGHGPQQHRRDGSPGGNRLRAECARREDSQLRHAQLPLGEQQRRRVCALSEPAERDLGRHLRPHRGLHLDRQLHLRGGLHSQRPPRGRPGRTDRVRELHLRGQPGLGHQHLQQARRRLPRPLRELHRHQPRRRRAE